MSWPGPGDPAGAAEGGREGWQHDPGPSDRRRWVGFLPATAQGVWKGRPAMHPLPDATRGCQTPAACHGLLCRLPTREPRGAGPGRLMDPEGSWAVWKVVQFHADPCRSMRREDFERARGFPIHPAAPDRRFGKLLRGSLFFVIEESPVRVWTNEITHHKAREHKV